MSELIPGGAAGARQLRATGQLLDPLCPFTQATDIATERPPSWGNGVGSPLPGAPHCFQSVRVPQYC